MAARPIPRSGSSTRAAAAGATRSYTARPENVVQRGGNLVVSEVKENYIGADGIARPYTSGRIETKDLFAQAYGRIEARMKLPVGKGIWPAFWMLGDADPQVKWPAMGEIDIMEAIGDPHTIYSTLHGPGYSGANGISKKFPLPEGAAIDSGFHVYAVEWAPNDLKFYFDDHLIAERTPADLPRGATSGLRASVLRHPQRRGGRCLAGQSRRDDPLPAADAGGLCEGVPGCPVAARPSPLHPYPAYFGDDHCSSAEGPYSAGTGISLSRR